MHYFISVLLTVAVSVTVFMLIKVVPIFTEMYEGMGVEIPGTAVIMSASAFLSGTGGFLSLIILIGALVAFNIGVKKVINLEKLGTLLFSKFLIW